MSSPDRGLDRAILAMDKIRVVYPEAELHVYYGLENLRKYGLIALADKIDALIAARPWVKVHGFTEQNKMYRDVADACVWLHPATFIETFCITAIDDKFFAATEDGDVERGRNLTQVFIHRPAQMRQTFVVLWLGDEVVRLSGGFGFQFNRFSKYL